MEPAPKPAPDESKLTIRLPKELHRRLRVVLAWNNASAQEMLVQVVARYVEREEERMRA